MAKTIHLAILLSSAFLNSAGAQTITVPQQEADDFQADIDNIRDMEMSVDFSTPNAILESLEGSEAMKMLDATGLGEKMDVAWEMQVAGSWQETVSGEGSLTVIEAGSQVTLLYALLENDYREAPLIVGMAGGESGMGTLDNHYFDSARIFQHARDAVAMDTPGFTALEGMTEDFLQTLFTQEQIQVVHAGESDDGSASWLVRFSATLQEEDSRGNPTGRIAGVQGWLCDMASYRDNPEKCQRDPFELVTISPPSGRHNVNPEISAIGLEFTHPVDINSLEEGFELFTLDAEGSRINIPGEWSHQVETEYHYTLEEPLLSGVRYRARVIGDDNPEGGVLERGTDEPLEETVEWEFTTLLNLDEQGVGIVKQGPGAAYLGGQEADSDHPLAIDVYQVVRNPELTRDKPAMARIWVDWERHPDIDFHHQPDEFDMALDISPDHSHIQGQKDLSTWQGEDGHVVRVFRQEEFNYNEIRAALHTIDAFGWNADSGDPRIEVTLAPEDPYPEPLEAAITTAEQTLDYWSHDPGNLRFHYAVLDIGDWTQENLGAISGGFAFDILNRFGSGAEMPEHIRTRISRLTNQIEAYVPQYMPYRGAEAIDSGIEGSDFELYWAQISDPQRALIITSLIGDGCYRFNLHPLTSQCTSNAAALAAYLAWAQKHYTQNLDPEDFFVLFVPEGILGEATVGTDLMLGDVWYYRGRDDLRARTVIVEIDYALDDPTQSYSVDQLALTTIHEFAHSLGLDHKPGEADEVPPIDGYKHDSIEAFRLDADGLGGYNKSAIEGNEEAPGRLAPLMWPQIRPSRDIMTAHEEFIRLQESIESGHGQ